MIDIENLDTKENIMANFFTWLFDDPRIKNKSINLKKEIDLSLAHDYMDPYIYYPEQIESFFNTKPMQRLARVSQLSLTVNMYPNTFHSRLEHSKGVYNRKVEEFIINFQNPNWKNFIEEHNLKLYLIAELIKVAGHDIGHFPLSHVFEEQVFNAHGPHEVFGQRLMLEYPEIQEVLSNISDELPATLKELYQKNILNFYSHDESSYDVDRLDYLSRDRLYKGYPVTFHTNNYTSSPKISVDSTHTDVYSYDKLPEIENFLLVRENEYDSLYMSKEEQALECAVGLLFRVLLENSATNASYKNRLCTYIRKLHSLKLEDVSLEDFIEWNDIEFYKEVLEIAQSYPDKNVRQIATLAIPKLEPFLNLIHSLLDNKKFAELSKSDQELILKIKKLISGKSELLADLANPNFLDDNIIPLDGSAYKESLETKGLTSCFSYKFKAYNVKEPVYLRTKDANFAELSEHPDKSKDWKNAKKIIHYDFAYAPFLRMNGLSEEEISKIKAGSTKIHISPEENKKSYSVNMSPLKVEHDIKDYFKNPNLGDIEPEIE